MEHAKWTIIIDKPKEQEYIIKLKWYDITKENEYSEYYKIECWREDDKPRIYIVSDERDTKLRYAGDRY